jgi:23S rRNA G2445 N2-methylase RlmL
MTDRLETTEMYGGNADPMCGSAALVNEAAVGQDKAGLLSTIG